jgi:hypothetical protein
MDCKFPLEEATEHDVDDPKLAPGAVAFQLGRKMLARVVLLTNVIEPPQYHEILGLDNTIRTMYLSLTLARMQDINECSALARATILSPYRASGEHPIIARLHMNLDAPSQIL